MTNPEETYHETGVEDYPSNWAMRPVESDRDFIIYERWTVKEGNEYAPFIRNNLTDYRFIENPTPRKEKKLQKWFMNETRKFPDHLHLWIRGKTEGE